MKTLPRLLLLVLSALLTNAHFTNASISAGAESIGEGWLRSEWFGDFLPMGNNWHYHSQWGWIYEMDGGTASAWIYVDSESAWYWVGQTAQPCVYSYAENGWRWFWDETSDPRLYYSYNSAEWLASDGSEGDIWRSYFLAIIDARVAEADEISHNLSPVTYYNPDLVWNEAADMVKCVSWMPATYISSYTVGEQMTLNWETWITLCPQVQDFAQAHTLEEEQMLLRVKQLLGLRPDKQYAYWVEFWVRPQDLYRPSADPSPTDCEAELDFPSSAEVTVSESYKSWFENNANNSYQLTRYGFPWTRLGYTYNWGNRDSEVGLSEFVIRPGSTVSVASIYTNSDYLTPIE
ncbi:MAG: hypothetical protein JW942_02925 [Opitutales bacterium]|nr:hypothetical protein [Opitutales bacterium]